MWLCGVCVHACMCEFTHRRVYVLCRCCCLCWCDACIYVWLYVYVCVYEWSVCADVWHVHVCLNLHQKHTLLVPGDEGILPRCDDSGILEVLSVQFPSPTWKACYILSADKGVLLTLTGQAAGQAPQEERLSLAMSAPPAAPLQFRGSHCCWSDCRRGQRVHCLWSHILPTPALRSHWDGNQPFAPAPLVPAPALPLSTSLQWDQQGRGSVHWLVTLDWHSRFPWCCFVMRKTQPLVPDWEEARSWYIYM